MNDIMLLEGYEAPDQDTYCPHRVDSQPGECIGHFHFPQGFCEKIWWTGYIQMIDLHPIVKHFYQKTNLNNGNFFFCHVARYINHLHTISQWLRNGVGHISCADE